MSKKFTGLDKSLLRVVEFRAQELGLDLEEWLAGAGHEPVVDEAPKTKPVKKKVTKKAAAKPEVEEDPLTIDDVRTALKAYMVKEGGPAARKVLESFGAAKLSEIEADDFAKLIKALS